MEVQTEWIHILDTSRAIEFNPDEIVLCKDSIMWPWVNYMCSPIRGKGQNIIFTKIKWLGNMGGYLIYTPTLKLQFLDMR